MKTKTILTAMLLLVLGVMTAWAQQNLQFSVVEFASDPFDTSARDERFKKIDGSGSPYAIIKVTSQSPSDDIRAYNFDFGNMNHRVDDSHDGELWLYVQKNAKTVTISRNGYNTLRRFDLKTTIEEGRNYKMVLSAQGPVVYTQMVVFQVKPASARAVVTVQREGGQKEMFGTTDETGGVAKNMEFGTYTYEIVAENYHLSEGRFTLNNQNENHIEQVELRTNGAMMTLQVDADADIYVNNTKRGTRTWSGLLKAGNYQVECRQINHRPSSQTITVIEGNSQTIQLTPPTPITGILSLTTRPLGANIKIDGRDYGTSPRNINNLLIGRHTLTLSRDGYQQKSEAFDIRENETTTLDLAMEKTVANTSIANNNSSANSRTFTVNGVSFVMKRVEGGTFQMGATYEQGSEAYDYEKPVHRVTLSDYYIGETEVTQALWQAVMGNNPSNFKGNSLPVESVSWSDCQEFIRKLNAQTGQRFRLPTEAEWEFAARGGKNSRGYKYSGSNTVKSVAWYADNSNSSTHPVKTKQANELGLYDMSGNVFEWCQDWYGSYNSSAQTNPTGPATGTNRVIRGGSWDCYAGDCRVSDRSHDAPSLRSDYHGLRLVCDIHDSDTQGRGVVVEKTVANTSSLVSESVDDKTFSVNGVSFVMKRVEGGTFQMGATSEQGSEAWLGEKPVHSVRLSDYYIGETEVTQALWQAVMGTTVYQQREIVQKDIPNRSWPIRGEGVNYPMFFISWDDCQEFIRKLNAQTGQKFRLPTEAEWEYAARGGKKSRGYKYSGSNELGSVAWYDDNSSSSTHPVGTKQPNELGLYDMSGNVSEWCQDWHSSYSSNAQVNPTGPATGSDRMYRGGSWKKFSSEYSSTLDCRVSARVQAVNKCRFNDLGFRLAL